MLPRHLRMPLAAAFTLAAILGGAPAMAQQTDRIAAVVNDDILSVKDVEARVKLAILLSHLPDTVDTRRRVVPQVVRKLIDEQLQSQEAKRVRVTVTPAEIDEGVANVERQNNLPRGSMLPGLAKEGVDITQIRQQIAADMLWYKLANAAVMPTIRVGEEEVTDRLEIIKARRGKPEFHVGEIFLPVENLANDDQIRSLGERLLEQLRQGAPFPMLANQFSQSATAANGGSMGWVSEGMIDDDQLAALMPLGKGQITQLLHAADGYRILGVIDRRIAGAELQIGEPSLVISQMVLPLPAKGPPKEALLARAAQITHGAVSCDDFEARGRQAGAAQVERSQMIRISALPSAVQRAVVDLPKNGVSAPMEVPEALQVVMVCERVEGAATALPSRDQVRRILEAERMDIMTTRYMRNLRRSAFIDIRM